MKHGIACSHSTEKEKEEEEEEKIGGGGINEGLLTEVIQKLGDASINCVRCKMSTGEIAHTAGQPGVHVQ